MRTVLQLVLIAALLLSGNAFAASSMPCCTASTADMQMPASASASVACHDAATAMAEAGSSMNVVAVPMLQCPRSSANLQVNVQWKNDEQAEPGAGRYMTALSAVDCPAPSPAAGRWSNATRCTTPPARVVSKSLPLRI